jgi:ATP-dependent helicase/nuclease subunit B
MLTVKRGPYHPSLETALAEDVRALAREHPFGRFALVVPSRHLLARVQEVLARDAKLSVVGLDLFTFHGLALRLYQEDLVRGGDGRKAPPVPLDDPDLLAHAIHCILVKVPRPNAILGHPAEFPGLARALCATVRDLREAQVDPARAIEAVGEGVFDGEDEEKLVALFRLAQAYDGILGDIGVLDPSALARLAVERAPGSAYLASLKRVLYYGFYDLTQQQLDFFAAVAKAFPTTCYIPGRKDHPAWAFANVFVTRHLSGIAGKVEELPDGAPAPALGGALSALFVPDGEVPAPAEPPPKPRKRKASAAVERPPLEIWSAAGARDEVWAVAKEIVGLLDAGVPADGIAVVARSLAPYLGEIDRTFRGNGIPYWTPGGLPLLQSPVARAVELLFEVDGGFGRSAVVELLASPYLARGAWADEGAEPRPDLWDLATRRCGIRGGLAEWRRLLKGRAGKPLRVMGDREAEEDAAGVVTVPPEQIDLLARGVEALAKVLGRIPDRGTWAEMADAARSVVRDLLRLPDLPKDASPEECDLARTERAAWAAVDGLWAGLRERDRLGMPARRDELVEAVREALGTATIDPSPVPHGGVTVLDAMAARGRSCRTLFLIGLNEKFFPRVVREDPFLRDGARHAVAGVLGHKMAEKLAGYEEEKLLLALLLGSAAERVVCTYQRSDEEGKVQVPSLYLREIRRAVFGIPFPDSEKPHTLERAIPRRLRDRFEGAPPDRLLRSERSLVLGMRGGDVVAFAEESGGDARGVGRSLAAVAILESHKGATEHDGKIPPSAKEATSTRPLSPTALETYATCPFRFFAARRLKLEPLERPEAEGETNVAEVGTLCHGILEAFYGEIAAAPAGAPAKEKEAFLRRLREIAEQNFETFERDAPVAYPLIWEALKARLLAGLEAFVAWDLASLREAGFRPALVEEEGRGEIPVPGKDAPPVACRGYMDRVDVADDGNELRFRVIDYKTGRPFTGSVKNAALRGTKLQLPVYLLIAREPLQARFPGRVLVPDSACYYFIAETAAEGEPKVVSLGGGFWEEEGAAMGETLRKLCGGVGAGFFLISPGNHCRSCDFATICRKGHYPTARRSREDSEWALVRPS